MSIYNNLTKKYANDNNPNILGRDKEMELLMMTMLRNEKPNALLIGPPGVGKTSIVHQLAYLIANSLCPSPLIGFNVIDVNTNALLAGPGYRGVTEEKFQKMIDQSLDNGKTILFLDEFHTVENLGQMSNGQTPGLGNTLKPYLTRPDFRMIGATTSEEFSRIGDKALLRRFFRIEMSEPCEEAVKRIIRSCLEEYGHGITFRKGVVDEMYNLSTTLDGYNPDKAKDICDFVCSYCKFREYTEVDTAMVDEVFDLYFATTPKKKVDAPAAIIEDLPTAPAKTK